VFELTVEPVGWGQCVPGLRSMPGMGRFADGSVGRGPGGRFESTSAAGCPALATRVLEIKASAHRHSNGSRTLPTDNTPI
jgi:hypothetical protein